ncbi:putative ribonuclease H-like domain-containing protein [Tanacetum coccineum]
MPEFRDDSNVFLNDGIFSGEYDDEVMGADDCTFNNMDNTIDGDPKISSSNKRKDPKGFFSQQALEEPKTISQALEDESWVEAMQEELLQFKLQKVWILIDLPFGKKAIDTKWVFRNKRDERSIVVKNKAKAVAQGFRQEEGINYDEVFAPVARIEAIRLFLAFASFMEFPVYQMNVKSAFLYGTIEGELGMRHFLLSYWKMVSGEVKQKHDGIFIRQDKYVADILKKFNFCSIKTTTTLIESNKPLVKDKDGVDVDVHVYRDSPFELEAFSDSDYGGASLNRKSTTGGCQFLGRRLISWQCKKKMIVANSTTEAEYVAAANYWEHVPLLPAMLAGAAEDQGEGSAIPADPHPTPSAPGPTITHLADEATTTRVGVETEGANTTSSGLNAGLDSGSWLRIVELKELMVLVPKLVTRIDNLEKELHHTKNTYGKAVLTLVERRRKIQDIDDDPLVSLVGESMKEVDFVTPTKVSASGEAQEEDISPTILEAAKTLSQVASQTVSTYKRRARSTDKGKDISTGLDAEAQVNTGSEDFNSDSIRVNTGSAPVSTPSVV